ncbi:MAG: hypothetical protein EOO73_13945 [Myxococcales bacterium]|nr:MAG: hypothetical protein EOO73_13945 [Myxococcales bacterium]
MTADPLGAYRAFVASESGRSGDDGYLFDTPRCRFALEPADELVLAPGAIPKRGAAESFIQLPEGAALPISGIPFERLRAALAKLPGSYSALTLELGPLTASFVEQTFSRVLFAPHAIAELEVEQPSLELVRFPGSPYEVVRSYWRNSIGVRRELEARALPQGVPELRALLLELHELMLLGAPDARSRSSFYLPASLLGRKRPEPGTFYEVPTGLERRGDETIVTSGARVSVPLLGGALYWQLLAESVNDHGALAPARALSVGGLELGQVVTARSEEESASRPWFLPPRPLTDAHFGALLAAWEQAHAAQRAQEPEAAVRALARFHHRFVRFHPLPSANQSLSMSFVNVVLRRVFGVGMPHLLLDQLALRFDPRAYESLFARAVRAWVAPWPAASSRLRRLMHLRQELDRFVSQIAASPSLVEARALLATERSGAELSLLGGDS